jgi:YD repeat-containing protein
MNKIMFRNAVNIGLNSILFLIILLFSLISFTAYAKEYYPSSSVGYIGGDVSRMIYPTAQQACDSTMIEIRPRLESQQPTYTFGDPIAVETIKYPAYSFPDINSYQVKCDYLVNRVEDIDTNSLYVVRAYTCLPYDFLNSVGSELPSSNGGTEKVQGFDMCKDTCPVNHKRNQITGACQGIPNPKAPKTCPATDKPINIGNGNKWLTETDYNALINLNFSRNYSAFVPFGISTNGKNWANQHLSRLVLESTVATAFRQDTSKYKFNLNSTETAWTADADITDKLTSIKDVNNNITGYTYFEAASGATETYNKSGQLLSITDRTGLTQRYTYNAIVLANSLPLSMTDYVGRTLKFTYDNLDRIRTMINPAGGVYTYAYDTNNNLSSVTYPDGKIKNYLYGSTVGESGNVSSTPESGVVYTNSLTGVIDENGDRYATYIYDSKGRATSEYLAGNADAASLVFNTDGSGNPTTTQVTDSRNNVNTYNFTTILSVVKSTGQSQPAGSGCAASASAITYDANGNLASRTDFNGNMTTFSYDMARNLEIRRTEGLNAAGNATPATRTITTTWHPTWRLPLVTSEFSGATATGTALRRTTNVYDAKGNITSIAEADPVRSLTRTTTITYTYSSLVPGLVLSKVVNGPRTDATDTTTYNYYDANATCTPSSAAPLIDPITNTSPPNLGCRGQLQSMTNALGQTTTYDRYNHHGQVEQMTDANGLVTTNTYDLRQRLLSRTVGTETTSLTYDNAGQVIQLTMPDNSQLNYTYDAAHRLTEVQDTLGNKVTYTLDSEGNRINEVTTDPLGGLAKTITRSYDALNRLQQVTGVE